MHTFKRKTYGKLLDWKTHRADHSALLIEGARRVGKSTMARIFGESEYRSFIVIDFWEAPQEIRDAFTDHIGDLDMLFRILQLYYNTRLYDKESLIVLDEVQLFPFARSCVKQLVADGRYHIIETGSLISIRQNIEGAPIPSEETAIKLDPLDFEEFLWAVNEDLIADACRESFEILMPLPEQIHRKAMSLFREYMLVGGMPQAVAEFIDANDFMAVDEVKRDIIALYRNDMSRFAQGAATKVRVAFDAIPGQLSKHEKKFTLAALGRNARTREYSVAFEWMSDSCITNMCRAVTDPQVGLALYEDDASFKCYMADTGLLVAHAFSDRSTTPAKVYEDILGGKLNLNEGMLVENAIAQQLAASGHKLRFFSQYNNDDADERMEIDFLVVREYENAGMKARISPIEVKSTKRYGTSSLLKFRKEFGSHVGNSYVLHPKPMEAGDGITYLPLYLAHCL